MDNAIYFLDEPVDDERWACFIPEETSSVLGLEPGEFQKGIELDFFRLAPKERNWQPHRLKDAWKPRKVFGDRNRVKPYNDYPALSVGGGRTVPTFSQKAVDALRDLLEPNGELLPLIVPPELGPYYAYNTTTVADVLDVKRCDGVSYGVERKDAFNISHLQRYEFFADKLAGLSIFRLPEFPRKIYVTEIFAQRMREHKLWGMLLKKVWPLPPDVYWGKLATRTAYEHLSPAGKRRWDRRNNPPQKKSPPLKVTSEALGEDYLAEIQKEREDLASRLQLKIHPKTPEEMQKWIHEEVDRVRAANPSEEERKEHMFTLAIAWGDTLVEVSRWEWVMLVREDGRKAIGVASANRAFVVPVITLFSRLLKPENTDNTSLLLFNMIRSGAMGRAVPNAHKLLQ